MARVSSSPTSPSPARLAGLSPVPTKHLALRVETVPPDDVVRDPPDEPVLGPQRGGSLSAKPGAAASRALGLHVLVRVSDQVHAQGHPRSPKAHVPADEQGSDKCTDQGDMGCFLIRLRTPLPEFAYLGAGKTFRGHRPGLAGATSWSPPRADEISSHSTLVLESIQMGEKSRVNNPASCSCGLCSGLREWIAETAARLK